jgi:HlyD family secretion protein
MKRKSRKKWIWLVIGAVLVVIVFLVVRSGGSEDTGPKTVQVEKRTIVDKALAVGSIEPLNEIAIKSKVSGVVARLMVELGDYVEKGQMLMDVSPTPTPLELVQAKREVERQDIALETLRRERDRYEELKKQDLVSDYEYESLRQQYEEANISRQMAVERLTLMESGKVRIADKNIETVINAPISGVILEKLVHVGDPVVPLTSYQAGTELLRMADMTKLIFRGTVDEIDVGRISEGMPVELQIGALPGKNVRGGVTLISLKARREENATVFPVEITIHETDDAVLRAGFSANANVIIAKKDSVPSIPERVVTFRNDSAFVRVPQEGGEPKELAIETGLSDAIYIEVLSGLELKQKVLEKEMREIQ